MKNKDESRSMDNKSSWIVANCINTIQKKNPNTTTATFYGLSGSDASAGMYMRIVM